MINDKIDPTDKIHIEFMDYLGRYLCNTQGEAAMHAEELTKIVIDNFEEFERQVDELADEIVNNFNREVAEMEGQNGQK